MVQSGGLDRATHALTSSCESRLEVFINGPLMALSHASGGALGGCVCSVVLVLALGLKLAWPKGSLGTEAHWIGAGLKADQTKQAVEVSVPAERSKTGDKQQLRLCNDTLDLAQINPEIRR